MGLPESLREIRDRLTKVERRLSRTPRGLDLTTLASTGDVKLTAAPAAPTGWLICAGQSVSRTTYAGLFAVIGTTYGSASGTTFNLPDMRGRVVAGVDTSQVEFDVLGERGGSKTHTLTDAQMPSHSHGQRFASGAIAAGGGSAVGGMTASGGGATIDALQATTSTGGGGAHNNLQPYIALHYIIKI